MNNNVDRIRFNHNFNNGKDRPKSGFEYFLFGWSIAFSPKIRHYVFFPLLANILSMSAVFYLFL